MPTMLIGKAQALHARYRKLAAIPTTDIATQRVAWDEASIAIREARRSIGPDTTESADIEVFQDLLREMEVAIGERP